ncbi:MAG: thermonuclease family protein [Deltaproteobacteria bacterium]|nr:thermonuclease family protein [Deltaproteobacteria bacterium]
MIGRLSLGAIALLACGDGERSPGDSDAQAALDGGLDAAADSGEDTGVPSGCPPPPIVRPEDVPEGYLEPEATSLYRPVDGDTAHFEVDGDHPAIRFLYVNTEESGGDEATDFGVATKEMVANQLEDASEIVLAVREDGGQPGSPDLDPYDRWLSLVFVDGELFQTEIVRSGMSAYYTMFGCAPEPVHSSLLWAEAEARANRRGIWEPGHPTDYEEVLDDWIRGSCRPNPFEEPYCP